MRHGSLFSGIGGFDLAAEWMGWENVFHCEWNSFGQKVLKHYWPHSISYNDITKTDFSIHRGEIDIITGGFPCQPYSSAGKRLGKEDSRHLWPEMCRAIREVSPRWIVGENVRGLTNWNGGMVFDEVQADLEAIGYEIIPFLLPACAVNAPHRRDRIWFIAYSGLQRQTERQQQPMGIKQLCKEQNASNATSDGYDDKSATQNNGIGQDNQQSGTQWERTVKGFSDERITTNTDDKRLERQTTNGNVEREQRPCISSFKTRNTWKDFPTVSPVCNGDDGFSNRLDSITFPKWRNESIKAGGNAVVPQVVYQIFKAIEQYGIQNPGCDKS